MNDNFEACFALTLKYEGGFVNDKHDPGGATNFGITIGTLSEYLGRPASVHDVQALKLDMVQVIYRLNYWNKISGDVLPYGVDMVVYDFAVNSGDKRGVISLQRALGIADDGVMGAVTRGKARSTNPDKVIEAVTKDRLDMMHKLTLWPRYGKGWTTRVAAIQKAAHGMVPVAQA